MNTARPYRLAERRIARHIHAHPYATVVLSGSYEEAGHVGRHVVGPGEVLVHAGFSAHQDVVAARPTWVIDLPLPFNVAVRARGRIADPDAIVQLAERDRQGAALLLNDALRPCDTREDDLADRLHMALSAGFDGSLASWSRRHGRARETIARQFTRLYGIDAAAFRAELRARRAWRMIVDGDAALAEIAATTGHADQAHMTRAVRTLTGATPGQWRRSHQFKTERAPSL